MIKKIKSNVYRVYERTVIVKKMLGEIKVIPRIAIPEKEILLLTHTLEKGMGMSDFKPGRGRKKAVKLSNMLVDAWNKGMDNEYAFAEGISVLRRYCEVQKDGGSPCDELIFQFTDAEFQKYPAGTSDISKEEIERSMHIDFESFVSSRHSIRHFKHESVQEEFIKKAIELANMAPSACNRQTCRVYYSKNSEINKQLGKWVPGNKGFEKDIYNYLILTARRELFGSNELYQWYVNGGIFLGYLTLALHSLGLGSCVFQWPQRNEYEKQLKDTFKIPKSEAIIAIIGFGTIQDKNTYLEASRRPIDEIGICHE